MRPPTTALTLARQIEIYNNCSEPRSNADPDGPLAHFGIREELEEGGWGLITCTRSEAYWAQVEQKVSTCTIGFKQPFANQLRSAPESIAVAAPQTCR